MKLLISFDYHKDKHYRYLLKAINHNHRFDLEFIDGTPAEIQSSRISVIKSALTRKIRQADCTLVIIGSEANKRHKDHFEIGYKNWLNFEIARTREHQNPIIAVKINKRYPSPEEIYRYDNTLWVYGFTVEKIENAIREIY